mmetsp:Transcript_29965/g.54286  ORF Transcript_29965/g.54286 Transcript_29965/m.54286 type:complete len:220 (+) Transcript_29965:328-987(+)
MSRLSARLHNDLLKSPISWLPGPACLCRSFVFWRATHLSCAQWWSCVDKYRPSSGSICRLKMNWTRLKPSCANTDGTPRHRRQKLKNHTGAQPAAQMLQQQLLCLNASVSSGSRTPRSASTLCWSSCGMLKTGFGRPKPSFPWSWTWRRRYLLGVALAVLPSNRQTGICRTRRNWHLNSQLSSSFTKTWWWRFPRLKWRETGFCARWSNARFKLLCAVT